MSTYFIGDIHGCFDELKILLLKVSFNTKKDTLWITGDLVARGPKSLQVLCFLESLGNSLRLVLGNHDLHLIAAYHGITNKKNKNYNNYLSNYLSAKKLIYWLSLQPLLQVDYTKKIVMSHAGITPQWDLNTAEKCASEIHLALLDDCKSFLKLIYEIDTPTQWNKNLKIYDRLKFGVNAFTKMRYCSSASGNINIDFKKSPKHAPPEVQPWFYCPRKISSVYNIIFGHWSCISNKCNIPEKIYALDTGCCWGGHLTLLRWEDKKYFTQNLLKN